MKAKSTLTCIEHKQHTITLHLETVDKTCMYVNIIHFVAMQLIYYIFYSNIIIV